MRRTSERAAHFVAATALPLALAACGGGLEVSLQIQRGTDANGNAVSTQSLQSLTITFDNEIDPPDRQTIPIDRSRQIQLEPLTIDKTKAFLVDVWGCDTPRCEIGDIRLRGCTPEPIDARDRVEPLPIIVRLLPAADETLRRCPDP